jgi:hypothetical protein
MRQKKLLIYDDDDDDDDSILGANINTTRKAAEAIRRHCRRTLRRNQTHVRIS